MVHTLKNINTTSLSFLLKMNSEGDEMTNETYFLRT